MNETGLLDFVYSNEIAQYDFSNSLVSLSACDTASGLSGRPDSVYGFVQNSGCRGLTLFCHLCGHSRAKAQRCTRLNFSDFKGGKSII